ncbi:TetR/AcrR family transcriptional regulator [Candidatus Contubernalis alkalaceticus]|nr:TetR/AcrR family transcriptional regulator [Candidatus Contubernalis alkalaceticus]UNC92086.1 TetR/AcrR family transcriptional regulator [Candidatus Contubernalis alkalaceticus]
MYSRNEIDKASTNMIVKRAGISRGLLYHYFKDKQEVFDFLVYYSIKVIIHDIKNSIDWNDGDIINREREISLSILHATKEYPYIFEFYQKHLLKLSNATITKYADDISQDISKKLYNQGIDKNMIKDDVDIDKMIAIIRYTVIGLLTDRFRDTQSSTLDTDQDIEHHLNEYFQFFRDLFYK